MASVLAFVGVEFHPENTPNIIVNGAQQQSVDVCIREWMLVLLVMILKTILCILMKEIHLLHLFIF